MRPRVLGALAAGTLGALDGSPDAVANLRAREGIDLVKGQWRFSAARTLEAAFKAPRPDLRPAGEPIKAYDRTHHAGPRDFDNSAWTVLDPTSLESRHGAGTRLGPSGIRP